MSTNVNHPMLSAFLRSPYTAAMMSKAMVAPANSRGGAITDAKLGAEVSLSEMNSISTRIARESDFATNALEMAPDLEISMQIVLTGLISPNNMLTQELMFVNKDPLLPPDLGNRIAEFVRDEIRQHYKIEEDMYDIARRALFTKGSVIRLVLPESAVDELINGRPNIRVESTRAIRELFRVSEPTHLNILGNPHSRAEYRRRSESGALASEPYNPRVAINLPAMQTDTDTIPAYSEENDLIHVYDNFALIKEGRFNANAHQRYIKDVFKRRKEHAKELLDQVPEDTVLSLRTESVFPNQVSLSDLKAAVFKSNTNGINLVQNIPDRDNLFRHSVGRPMDVDVPAEAFVPVHYPNDPKKLLGAYFLVDDSGYFLSMDGNKHMIDGAMQSLMTAGTSVGASSTNSNLSSSLMARAHANLVGTNDQEVLSYLPEIFSNIIEENLLNRFRNGVNGMEAALAKNNDAYLVMMARYLCGAQTKVIYVPKTYFTNFVFNFNPNGTGRSLITGVKHLVTLRALNLYARVATNVRNSIAVTQVNVKLGENDRNPNGTLAKIKDLVSQTRSQYLPWGLDRISDIATWWKQTGYQLNVEDHPRLMNTKISYEFKDQQRPVNNLDDDKSLDDMIQLHFGVTPEMRDAGRGADFATSIANANILFTKRVQLLQEIFNNDLSDYVRIVATNDPTIETRIKDILKEGWGDIVNYCQDEKRKALLEAKTDQIVDDMTEHVIGSLEVELPRPKVNRLRQQVEAFKDMREAVDDVFDACFTNSDLANTPFYKDQLETLKELFPVIKSEIIRRWMQEEGFMSEVFDLFRVDEGKTRSELSISVPSNWSKLIVNLISMLRQSSVDSVALQKDLQDILNAGNTEEAEQESNESY